MGRNLLEGRGGDASERVAVSYESRETEVGSSQFTVCQEFFYTHSKRIAPLNACMTTSNSTSESADCRLLSRPPS